MGSESGCISPRQCHLRAGSRKGQPCSKLQGQQSSKERLSGAEHAASLLLLSTPHPLIYSSTYPPTNPLIHASIHPGSQPSSHPVSQSAIHLSNHHIHHFFLPFFLPSWPWSDPENTEQLPIHGISVRIFLLSKKSFPILCLNFKYLVTDFSTLFLSTMFHRRNYEK